MMKMMKNEMGTKIIKLFVITAAVYLGMKFIVPIVLPFLLAFALARLLYPLAGLLEKKAKCRKTTARLLAYGIFLAGIGVAAAGLLWLFYYMGSSCLNHVDDVKRNAYRIFCVCCDRIEQVSGFGTEEIQRTISREASGLTKNMVAYSKDAGWYMIGLLAKIFVTFIAALLILNDYERITGGIKKTQTGRAAFAVLKEIKEASGTYFGAQLRIMAIITAICIGGLFLLGIPYAFWIGLGIGFCDALPFIGTGTIFVPWALIELLLGNYQYAAGLFLYYVICSFVRELLEPKLVGKHLGVPPLAVLMSIYIGIQLYGGAGVIFGPVSALLIYEVYRIVS